MKAPLLFSLSLLLGATLAQARTLEFPEKKPLITFEAPDAWKPQMKNGSLFVLSPEGSDVIVEVMNMEAAIDDEAAALQEARGTVSEDFQKLKLSKGEPTKYRGLTITLLAGSGEDRSGPAQIDMAVLRHPGAAHPILVSIITAKDASPANHKAASALFDTLSAAGAAAPAPAAGPLQTFSYPDKNRPDFSLDFPGDWKMKPTDEGAYVESPDRLVAMNVIIVDKANVADAVSSLSKSIGERFKEPLVWNGGKEPEPVVDPALGLTATFRNTVASDGPGTEKYAVNLVTYVRKNGDKALVFLCQNPLRALEKHGDAMEAVLKSIKAR